MLDALTTSTPRHDAPLWPEDGKTWVMEPRHHAPGLDSLLRWAFEIGAHRIAFQTGHPVWLGVHGRNRRVTAGRLTESQIGEITNHLYGADGMARLQGGQDFDTLYVIPVDRVRRLRFRLNACSTRTERRVGANIVLRPIADLPPPLEQQRVEPTILDAYRPRDGMVIVGGGTGSGKSTLIGGMTRAKLQEPHGHYNIVEGAAPVEFLLEGFALDSPTSTMNQSEIPKDYPSFDAFLRGCMRREPTDIIVGECRDGATMTASINAAISGHALTTTIHANDGPSTIQRMVSLCPSDERENLINGMAQSLRLVINQRLIPTIDGKRTAIREFVAFDRSLRTRFLRTPPEEWASVMREATETDGQSFRVAIQRALDEDLINEDTARRELREVG